MLQYTDLTLGRQKLGGQILFPFTFWKVERKTYPFEKSLGFYLESLTYSYSTKRPIIWEKLIHYQTVPKIKQFLYLTL